MGSVIAMLTWRFDRVIVRKSFHMRLEQREEFGEVASQPVEVREQLRHPFSNAKSFPVRASSRNDTRRNAASIPSMRRYDPNRSSFTIRSAAPAASSGN